MSIFYGWVIVAVGIVVSCIGMGGVMSLGVFLQPMADTLGWSRAGISTASTLALLPSKLAINLRATLAPLLEAARLRQNASAIPSSRTPVPAIFGVRCRPAGV